MVCVLILAYHCQSKTNTHCCAAGAAAYDASDGRLPFYQVLTTGVFALNTSSAASSFQMRYDAKGANCAPATTPIFRTVNVVDPCPAPEHTCPGSLVCSVLSTCVLLPLGGRGVAVAVVAVTPDTTPPTITLRGPGVLDSSGVMMTNATLGLSFTDPGATAADSIDGDITAHIITTISNSKGVAVPAVLVSVPTGDQSAFFVTYDVIGLWYQGWEGSCVLPEEGGLCGTGGGRCCVVQEEGGLCNGGVGGAVWYRRREGCGTGGGGG